MYDGDFKRVTTERGCLQLRLKAADQRIDELTARQPEPDPERPMDIIEQYPNGVPLQYNAAVKAVRKNAQ